MPGIGELIEGAMQHAPHCERHSIAVLRITRASHSSFVRKRRICGQPRALLPIDGSASGMGILLISDGLPETHGQDAGATADIRTLPTIRRCAPRCLPF
jgi:hypothetical protein